MNVLEEGSMSGAGRNRRGHQLITMSVAAALPGLLSPRLTSTVAGQDVGSTQSASGGADLTDALRFRSEFGLDTDLGYVELLDSTTAPSAEFGIALSSDEEALMERRGAIPAELGKIRAYRASHPDIWGGAWLSYPTELAAGYSLRLNVAVTGDPGTVESDLKGDVPYDVELVVTTVKHTELDLNTVVDRVSQDGSWFKSIGTTYESASTRFPDDVVEIAVSDAASPLVSAIQARYGTDLVRVVQGDPVEGDSCTRTTCGPPWKGGLKIYRSSTIWCTSGYVVNHYDPHLGEYIYALLTAGHCGDGTWRLGSGSGTVIGTTSANYFGPGSAADAQIIPIALANSSNIILSGTASCNPCSQVSIVAREGATTDFVGETVCNNGAYSGIKCGSITSTNWNFYFTDCGCTLPRMRQATYMRHAGDSGGPVTTPGNTAEGSHTDHQVIGGTDYAAFSQIWEIENASGYWVVLSP